MTKKEKIDALKKYLQGTGTAPQNELFVCLKRNEIGELTDMSGNAVTNLPKGIKVYIGINTEGMFS